MSDTARDLCKNDSMTRKGKGVNDMIVWKVEMMYISPITWEKKWVLYGHTTTRVKARELTRAVREAGQWDGTRIERIVVW